MASADEKRGNELAELARLLLLWFEDNELPGSDEFPAITGLKDTPPGDFELFAGTYHLLARPVVGNRSAQPLLPTWWADDPAELKRLQDLRLGISFVLLVDNPSHLVRLADGRVVAQNRIVEAKPGAGLDREGTLITVAPELDSRKADDATIGRTRSFDISSLLHRVDMVWDDRAEAAAARFPWPELLQSDVPRPVYDMNLDQVLVPAGKDPRQFKDTLYFRATYSNRNPFSGTEGGNHYDKWRAPKAKAQREIRPTLLTEPYLRECFTEWVMKKGDDILLVQLPMGRAYYRLLRNTRPRKPSEALSVQLLVALDALDTRTAAELAVAKAAGTTDTPLRFPVPAVLFHCLDGGNTVPGVVRGTRKYASGTRFSVDLRAYLRWYHGAKLELGRDENWFESFVDTFFADSSYLVDLEHPTRDGPDLTGKVAQPLVDRDRLFLDPLRAGLSDGGDGPVKDQLQKLVAWCEESPYRFVFLRGTNYGGPAGKPHELIGISPDGEVYEWLPHLGVVTRMKLDDWFTDLRLQILSEELYKDTAGMLPVIAVVTWGGAIAMTGGVLGMGGWLGGVARETVRQLGISFAGKQITEEAARKAAPFLTALIVETVIDLIPKDDDVWAESTRRFLHGFCAGFAGGAVTHYLSSLDERLVRAAELVPEVAANVASKGIYRAYLVYRKVSVAVDKLTILVKTIKVLERAQARKIAEQLKTLGKYVGIGFLVIVFVLVYINFLVKNERNELDEWFDRQQRTLQHMIKATGDAVAGYLHDLHEEIAPLLAAGKPVPATVLHKHDEKLAAVLEDKLADGVHEAAGVADFLVLLAKEVGIKNWHDLHGIDDLLARGWDALPKDTVYPELAEMLGHAAGEFFGTWMLESRLTPEAVKKGSSWMYGRQPHDVTKRVLKGGVWRALWYFVLFPFRDIETLDASIRGAIASPKVKKSTPGGATFSKIQRGDSAYKQLFLDLVGDSDEVAQRIIKLAQEEHLEEDINKLVVNATAGMLPPHFGDLIKSEHPEWPGKAVMFVLYCWLRIGMRRLLLAFDLIHDDTPFDGKFKFADLLDVLGIDVNIDDVEALALKKLTLAKQ